ncbi:MAG: TIGR02301 family protein [Salinarimonadaceae bacterium]|nr:MAG: TIGR02301 family protein [Salinarimonadaceae bacterium]
MLVAALALAAAQAFAQAPPPQVQPGSGTRPVYEAELLRLSEVIGALAFLRDLCGAADADEWPERMRQLIAAEGPERAPRLAGAYNRGYGGFALTYRTCTPSAEVAMARYLDEGDRLSRLIATRYGG